MIRLGTDGERDTALAVADLMMTAARTAPKASGTDKITAITLTGHDKTTLSNKMRGIAKEIDQAFFDRDATNVDNSHCIVLIGVKDIPLALKGCGQCGFENCGLCKQAGSLCTFNNVDLGIAIGSAVSLAADNRIDNRVMYSAGRAAVELKLLGPDVKVCYGIPLYTGAKSIFFDRGAGSVLV